MSSLYSFSKLNTNNIYNCFLPVEQKTKPLYSVFFPVKLLVNSSKVSTIRFTLGSPGFFTFVTLETLNNELWFRAVILAPSSGNKEKPREDSLGCFF